MENKCAENLDSSINLMESNDWLAKQFFEELNELNFDDYPLASSEKTETKLEPIINGPFEHGLAWHQVSRLSTPALIYPGLPGFHFTEQTHFWFSFIEVGGQQSVSNIGRAPRFRRPDFRCLLGSGAYLTADIRQ